MAAGKQAKSTGRRAGKLFDFPCFVQRNDLYLRPISTESQKVSQLGVQSILLVFPLPLLFTCGEITAGPQ